MSATGERRRTTQGYGSSRSSRLSSPRIAGALSGRSHKTTTVYDDDASRRPPATISRSPSTKLFSTPTKNSSRSLKYASRDSVLSFTPKRRGSRARSSGLSSLVESPGKRFSISGTTFLATDSEHEEHGLDPGLMLEALPDLVNASDKALKNAAPSNVTSGKIQRALGDRAFMRRLEHLNEKFEVEKKLFGTKHFITLGSATKALPSVTRLEWKPERIWNKANLARFALDIVSLLPGSFEDSRFQLVDEHFPSSFIDAFPSNDQTNSARLKRETFDLGLEIRTQWCLMSIRKAQMGDEAKDPHEILEEVFIIPSLGDSQDLRGWNAEGFKDEMETLPDEFVNTVSERMDHIRQTFHDGGMDLEELDAMFPWPDFVVQLISWIRKRTNEIDEQLKSQEPLDDIIPRLREELERRSSFGQHSVEPEHDSPVAEDSGPEDNSASHNAETGQPQPSENPAAATPLRPRNFSKKWCVSHLERRFHAPEPNTSSRRQQEEEKEEEVNGTSHDASGKSPVDGRRITVARESADAFQQTRGRSHTDRTAREQTQNNVADQPLSDGSDSESSVTAILMKAKRNMMRTAEGKQKSPVAPARLFNDPQSNARRISPIDGNWRAASPDPNTRSPRKRKADEMREDSPSFQRDNRQIDIAKNQARVPKKRRVEDEDYQVVPVDDDDDYLSEATRGSSRHRAPPVAPPPKRRPRMQVAVAHEMDRIRREKQERVEDYDHQKSTHNDGGHIGSLEIRGVRPLPPSLRPGAAREASATPPPYIPKPRSQWTKEENDRLIYLIGQYGLSWTLIKTMDFEGEGIPQLAERGQVNIKDRARQLTFQFYRDKQALPKNFQFVRLQSSQRERLHEMGIEVLPTN